MTQHLRADGNRLAKLIDRFAELSEMPHRPGVTRLAYTALERDAHALFRAEMDTLGLSVWTDDAGNSYAERAGSTPSLPAIGTGSHLDSVPNAGKFDGIAGVAAAMETARLLAKHEVEHRHPFRFVVFAAEEGSRFGQACTGSRIAAGLTASSDLYGTYDPAGVSIAEAMSGVSLDPDAVGHARWHHEDWAGFVELHIEQGSVLESSCRRVGVVNSISGSTRFRLDLTGRASHSGGTPMHLRADAVTAAAEIILLAESAASDEHNEGTRATVGKIDVEPGSLTTIAGSVALWVDVRGTDAGRQRRTAAYITEQANVICSRRGIELHSNPLADTPPVALPDSIREALTATCEDLEIEPEMMPSGASHDAQQINTVTPTGMLFIPSKGGISHDPHEWSSSDEIALGTTVLAASLRRLDRDLP